MTQAAIFDLDGTLIDLPVDWEALFDKLRQIMHTQNVRPLTLTISSLDAQTRKLAFAVWDEAELAVAPKFKLIDEGMKVYHENANKPKILITMQGKKSRQRHSRSDEDTVRWRHNKRGLIKQRKTTCHGY